jgi:hypothetical protein
MDFNNEMAAGIGTDTEPPPGTILILHTVLQDDDFEKAARQLFEVVKIAQDENPGAPRALYLEIEGHKTPDGFDADMCELQREFAVSVLLPYLTSYYCPMLSEFGSGIKNLAPQRDDVPTEFYVLQNEQECDMVRQVSEMGGKKMRTIAADEIPSYDHLFSEINGMNWWKFAKKKAEEHTGVLVGLCLPSAAAKELAWSGEAFNLDKEPEEASDLHLSLAFLGSALELDRQHDAIVTALQHFADQFPPLKGVISGLGQFDGRNGGSSCVYASLDAPELPDMRHRLLKCLNCQALRSRSSTASPRTSRSNTSPKTTLCR